MGYKRIRKYQNKGEVKNEKQQGFWHEGAHKQHGIGNMNNINEADSINDGTKESNWEDYVNKIKIANEEAILNRDKQLLESQWKTGDYGGFNYVNMPEEFYTSDDQGNTSFNMDLLYENFLSGKS
jgi:hypothetical protein